MAQSIEQILSTHRVPFRSSGSFELLVHCPLCGASDPSEHLAISTRKRGWRCLRNSRQHKGASYIRLLELILHCSEERAKELLGIDRDAETVLPDADVFGQQWRKQLGLAAPEKTSDRTLEFPREFKKLRPSAKRSDGFWDYLTDPLPRGRGFTFSQAEWVAKTYNLYFAISGRFSYRIIIPIYDVRGRLVNWTGRSIDRDADIRYLTLAGTPKEPGDPFSLVPPGKLILGLPILNKAAPRRCLVVGEGPFDGITVSALGHEAGVWGTCLFGLELSNEQGELIADVGDSFDRLHLALDPKEAVFRRLEMKARLPRRIKTLDLPQGFKDPGTLTNSSVGRKFVLSLAS